MNEIRLFVCVCSCLFQCSFYECVCAVLYCACERINVQINCSINYLAPIFCYVINTHNRHNRRSIENQKVLETDRMRDMFATSIHLFTRACARACMYAYMILWQYKEKFTYILCIHCYLAEAPIHHFHHPFMYCGWSWIEPRLLIGCLLL